MELTIGEFARLLGLSPSTIRYYEKLGLCASSRDPENNYRRYSENDALAFMNLKSCRSLEMGIGELLDATQKSSLDEQRGRLRAKKEEALSEISRLKNQVKRIEELDAFYAAIENDRGIPQEITGEKAFCLYTIGANPHNSDEAGRLAGIWMDRLPFTFIAVGITGESFRASSGPLGLRLGVGALERYQMRFELPLSPEIEVFPQKRGVYQWLSTRDFFSIKRTDIAPLKDYLDAHGLEAEGDITGRVFVSEFRDGAPLYHLSFRAIVKDK